ncbi:response regulator [Bacillus horti]|uniref:Two-component SAPR family response regulator n=1 Tax=Caldalkalibacillus horti TaxID=77523 RepID=A0ABT9W0N7_9BACI|nr:response regulator [Bacillus horti]MDQ0166836.1 two-component SAPR family response regulator [Bacillus horti]
MRAILVDDEQLALKQLKQIFERDIDGVEIVETCSDPYKVLEIATKHLPDAIFLDIRMPEIDGLKLGEQIQTRLPDVEIVFVTAYDRYAVQAFDLHALDYIMKPVQTDRLRRTIERLQGRFKKRKANHIHGVQTPFIYCFNQIRYQLPGVEPQTIKWRTSKAQELFAYLLHYRGRTIDRSTIIELLWPNLEVSRASQQLYTTIYHIRQTLKRIGLETISISSGDLESGYKLIIGNARVDVDEWENRLKQLGVPHLEHIKEHERIFKQFDGNYFGEYDYLWAEHERERLRLLWLIQARNLGRLYIEHGMAEKAIQVYRIVQQLLPDVEETYFTLMKLYKAVGDIGGVEEQSWLLSSRMDREWN